MSMKQNLSFFTKTLLQKHLLSSYKLFSIIEVDNFRNENPGGLLKRNVTLHVWIIGLFTLNIRLRFEGQSEGVGETISRLEELLAAAFNYASLEGSLKALSKHDTHRTWAPLVSSDRQIRSDSFKVFLKSTLS